MYKHILIATDGSQLADRALADKKRPGENSQTSFQLSAHSDCQINGTRRARWLLLRS